MAKNADRRNAVSGDEEARPEGETPEANTPSEDLNESERRRLLLHHFAGTARQFWRGRQRFPAWLLTAGLLSIILAVVAAAYAMNLWNRAIFDALEQRNAPVVGQLALIYFGILAVSVAFSIAQVHMRTAIQRRWRCWVTTNVIDRWLLNGRYYQLNLVTGDHANPEARMSDDVRIATDAPVDFVTGVLQAFLSAATFIVMLWTIGGSLDLAVVGIPLQIPGFLVIAAVLYASIASGAMVEALQEINPRSLETAAPTVYDQLLTDADGETAEKFLSAHAGGLTGYIAELTLWCRWELRQAEARPNLLAMAKQVRARASVLPAGTLEILSRYQTTLDNQLYKALRALREAQEWRLKTIEPISSTTHGPAPPNAVELT